MHATNIREDAGQRMLNKVPEVTLFFWIIKILCTTVGETAADFLNTCVFRSSRAHRIGDHGPFCP